MTLENSLANYSFLSLLASMIFYWIETSFTEFNLVLPNKNLNEKNFKSEASFPLQGEKEEVRIANFVTSPPLYLSPESSLNIKGLASSYKNSKSLLTVDSWTKKKRFLSVFEASFAKIGIIISNFLLGLLLLLRWKESGHFPLSNLYESLLFLSWCFTGLHLYIDNYTSNKTKGNNNFVRKLLGSITTPSALLTNAFATFTLPKEMQEASPLVPALQSNWLMMHVTVMILSYAALILGSLISIAFLILTTNKKISIDLCLPSVREALPPSVSLREEKEGNGSPKAIPFPTVPTTSQGRATVPFPVATPPVSFENGKANSALRWRSHTEKQNILFPGEAREANLQNNDLLLILDNLSYRILGIGFPLLTIGILSGAVWANEAWGSYWSWDPKETWALLTWLIFAIYLHTRISKGWEGKKPALIASFGFLIVWMCYLGVNLLGEGLHSYGWLSNA